MKKRAFVAPGPPARIVFGPGCVAQAGITEILALPCQRLIVIGSRRALASHPSLAQLQAAIQPRVVGVFDDLQEHVPANLVQDKAADMARLQADGLLVVGGGSPLGLAKALAALFPAVLLVSIPTTYSGSEVTAYYGVSETVPGPSLPVTRKVAKRLEAVRPRLVLYDAALLQHLPRGLAVASLFNALAHAFEALWVSARPSPLARMAATESIRTILRYLPDQGTDETDDEGVVNELLFGAYLAGYSLDAEELGLQHRLAHVLGGTYHLPHALAHMLLLPHVVRHYEDRAGPSSPLAGLLPPSSTGAGVATRVFDLQRQLLPPHAPRSLKDLGLQETDLAGVVDTLLAHGGIPENPDAPLEKGALEQLLRQAWAGERPASSAPPRPPRITYLSDEAFSVQDPAAAAKILARRQGQLLNLDRVLMHAPAVAQGWNAMFGSLRTGLTVVDGRLRELVICRVAVLNRAYYEYYQHYPVLLAEGGTAAEAEALGDWRGAGTPVFGPKDRAVLAYVDEMTRQVRVQEATVEALKAVLAREGERREAQFLVELTALCAGYNMVSRFLETLHLTPETTDPASLPRMPEER